MEATEPLPTVREAPLRLELRLGNERTLLEFWHHTERAFVLGSNSGADITVPGLSPVELYFERRADRIWMVPAGTRRGLRINARPVDGPRALDGYAWIERGDVCIEARVHEQATDPVTQHSTWPARPLDTVTLDPGAIGESTTILDLEDHATLPRLLRAEEQPTAMLWTMNQAGPRRGNGWPTGPRLPESRG